MFQANYKFELPSHHKSIIKVIGVGGGGSNAVNHMYNQGIKDVEFVVCNTDAQALKSSPVPNKLQIGITLTEGLGAGANPDKGKNAAIESREDIREMLSNDTKMIFITAGMGGGTGTGAAPIIAKVARELDILTVGIVTAPFSFEGKKKITQAELGITEMKTYCDTVLVISNDKLREIFGNLTVSQAFAQADNVLTTAAKGIAEIITVPGYVNVDFEDVKTVMKGSGAAVMGSAQTEGQERAIRAAEEAISSPLLNNKNIHGAQKILLSIISGDKAELQMDELSIITEFIQEKAGDDAEVIFGHGIDPSLGECIRVTVIATGFEGYPTAPLDTKKKVYDLEGFTQTRLFDDQLNIIKPEEKSRNQVNAAFEKQEEKTMLNLGDTYELIDESDNDGTNNEKPQISELNRLNMSKISQERKKKIKNLGGTFSNMNNEEFKEKEDIPAYIRKNIKLPNVMHSSENNISRFNLNEDNQILGNNKFLHDNVD